MLLICANTLIQASLVHVLTQYSKHVGSLVNQTIFRERACASERGRGGRDILFAYAFAEYGLVHETSVWANMRISLKVDLTRSLRKRQMLKVDLCANGAGAYAPYAPPLPTGLSCMNDHAAN